MVIDIVNHTYSAYVTPASGTEQVIGTNLSFRIGQGTVTSLNNWTVVADAGSFQACSLVIAPPQSQTRTLQQGLDGYLGVTDTWLNYYDPNLNLNNESKLTILGGSENAKVLLRFDLSSIPANAVIISATLSVYNYSHQASANGGTLSIHRVDKQWVEWQATWNVYSSGNAWTAAGMQAGTDYVSSPANSITIDTSTNVWRSFDVTAQIQQWVSGAAQNNGFVVRSPTYGVKPNFYSSGYLLDPTLRPKLSITYQ
jgi:hypothetical protein